MKTIQELRDEYYRMSGEEIKVENLLCQVRTTRALEQIAHHLEQIDDNINRFKLY